jgi:hypothetical protein
VRPERDSASVDTLSERIFWSRRGAHCAFVGTLRAGDDGIRLTGRDPRSGLDVALSIPLGEVHQVHVAPADEGSAGDTNVVVELAGAEPILLRRVGARPLQTEMLARRLGALLQPPRLLIRGG